MHTEEQVFEFLGDEIVNRGMSRVSAVPGAVSLASRNELRLSAPSHPDTAMPSQARGTSGQAPDPEGADEAMPPNIVDDARTFDGVALDVAADWMFEGQKTVTLQGAQIVTASDIVRAGVEVGVDIDIVTGAHSVIASCATTSATLNDSNAAALAGCIIKLHDSVTVAPTTHIGVRINNLIDSVKLDLRGRSFDGVQITKAFDLGGKIHVLYGVSDLRIGAPGAHEVVVDDVSGPDMCDNDVLTTEDDGHGGALVATCFLEGTQIATPHGWRRIETLHPGDRVWTFEGNQRVQAAVTWLGHGDAICRPDMPDDLAGYPVRIARDAIGSGVPFEDVYVTSEHRVYLDGGLIPARMLVNGGSIAYVRNRPQYRFYHLETAAHSIVSAGNLKTETYLDTGNRKRFSAGSGVPLLRPDQKARLAAPLKVAAKDVAPVYHRLAEMLVHRRRLAMQPLCDRVAPPKTCESDLRLVLPDGREFWPVSRRGKETVFNLPADVQTVWLQSRASRPCDAIGPWVDDRRSLGVMVGAIKVVVARQVIEVLDHLTTDAPGWHEADTLEHRWTNGCARLNLSDIACQDADALHVASLSLQIEICAQGPYVLNRSASRERDRVARPHVAPVFG